MLAQHGSPKLDDARFEREEFEVLFDEILSTEHFDRLERQRFLALWCVGHILESAAWLRAVLVDRNPAT